MKQAKIVPGTPENNSFDTTTKNTSLSQRETLEEVMMNLATYLHVLEIKTLTSSRGAIFYSLRMPQQSFDMSYQSASNTILELSRALVKRAT
ncbi:MAG: hypothetical protein Q7J42_05250 [Sulfuritalea sp.]|nr:hypothetical protein [Sulfuritalea sp.]